MSKAIHDLALVGARVIDPASGHDAVADVALTGDRITAVGSAAGDARVVLDVSGSVLCPGFVDLHSHNQAIPEQRLQVLDGVTTALECEAGALGVERAYERALAEGRPVNFGFSASWALARMTVLTGRRHEGSLAAFLAAIAQPAWQRAADMREVRAITDLLEGELAAGALGIGILVGYAPLSQPEEYLAVARLAASRRLPTFTHARELVENEPETPLDGAHEVVRAAAETGAAMHYCHMNSTSTRHIDRVLGLIEQVRAEGSQVTGEAYPYGTGMTGVGASFLAPERLGARGLTPASIRPAATNRPFRDAEELEQARRHDPEALVFVDFLDDLDDTQFSFVERALVAPGTVVASDAVPITWPRSSPRGPRGPRGGARSAGREGGLASGEPPDPMTWPLPPGGVTHPRSAGTFARFLRLARERGWMSLPEAVARCSTLPAAVAEQAAPAMARKGRVQVGCDADLVVFDPEAVGERASFADSLAPSAGIVHVLVNGEFVVRSGELLTGQLPGRAIRGRG